MARMAKAKSSHKAQSQLLAEPSTITHKIAALPVDPARILTTRVAVAFSHAGVVGVSAELRTTETLDGVGDNAAASKNYCCHEKAKECFSYFHLTIPSVGGGFYAGKEGGQFGKSLR